MGLFEKFQMDVNALELLLPQLQAQKDAAVALNSNSVQQIETLNQQLQTANSNLAAKQTALDSALAQLANNTTRKKDDVGINLHMSDPNYSNIDGVVANINNIGFRKIRQDFDTDKTTGKFKNETAVLNWKRRFDSEGYSIRAMLYARQPNLTGTASENFDKGANQMTLFLKNYGADFFKEIELDNEAALGEGDSIILRSKGGNGDKAADFNPTGLEAMSSFVQGMYSALLGTNIKIITNTEWLHQYYIDKLRMKLTNAWISAHMYFPDFDNAARIKGMPYNQYLKKKYGDMFFEIGETGYTSPLDGSFDEDKQVAGILKVVALMKSWDLPYFLFELRDRKLTTGREAHFGLYKGDGTEKKVVAELKKVLYL